jgi:hypothetical protein
MWALIDVNRESIVKFFLFSKNIKFNNITRSKAAPAILKQWIHKRRTELGVSPSTKGELIVKRKHQFASKQIKQLLSKAEEDFHVTLVDDLQSQGLPWGDRLIDTLSRLPVDTDEYLLFEKMETEILSKEDVVELKKFFTQQAQNLPCYVRDPLLESEDEGSDVPGPKASD